MQRVSVVMACRNEVKNIRATVESILQSDYPDVEILICDGMSDDGTREVLTELSKKNSNVHMIDNPERFTPYAFNHGITNSTGEYILISGARNLLEKDYISLLVKSFSVDEKIACVGGDYIHRYDNEMAKYISYAMESKFGVGASNYRTKKEDSFVDTVGIPMYRKSIFTEIGLFDVRFTRNQDDELNFRLTKLGYKIYYCFKAKTHYLVRSSFFKLFKQYSQYGYFKVLVNKKHKGFSTLRQVVPFLFLLFLCSLPLILIMPKYLYLYLMILSLYLLLSLYFSLQKTKSLKSFLLVMWAMFLMHFSYGLGYAKGILHFLILGKSASQKMQKQTL